MTDSIKIGRDSVVSFHYRLSKEGEPHFEDSHTGDPVLYLHGHRSMLAGLEEALEGPYKKEGLDINDVENWPAEKINWVPQELKENVGRSLTDRFNNFKTNLKNNRT